MKKIFRWIAIVLPLGLIIPLCVNCWELFIEDSLADPQQYGMFSDFESLAFWKKFDGTWTTIFAILACASLAIGIITALIYLCDSLKVAKLNKIEKPMGFIYLATCLATIIVGILVTIVYVEELKILTYTRTYAINPAIGVYLFTIIGLISSVLFLCTTQKAQTAKKKK